MIYIIVSFNRCIKISLFVFEFHKHRILSKIRVDVFLVLRSSSLIKSMAYLASSVAHGVPSILRGLVATCLSPSKQQPLILSITSFPLFETRLMIFSFIYCIFKSRYLDVDLFFTLCLCGNLGVCFCC